MSNLMSSRCLSWEQWEEETWTNSVTLNVTLEGGNLVNIKLNLRFGTKFHAGDTHKKVFLLFRQIAKPQDNKYGHTHNTVFLRQ